MKETPARLCLAGVSCELPPSHIFHPLRLLLSAQALMPREGEKYATGGTHFDT